LILIEYFYKIQEEKAICFFIKNWLVNIDLTPLQEGSLVQANVNTHRILANNINIWLMPEKRNKKFVNLRKDASILISFNYRVGRPMTEGRSLLKSNIYADFSAI